MPRYLQIKWSDEKEWKDARRLWNRESGVLVIRTAEASYAETKRRYKHKVDAEFRIVQRTEFFKEED